MKELVKIIVLLGACMPLYAQEAQLRELIKEAKVTGIQLAYTQQGKTQLYALGMASTAKSTPVTPVTVFQAASLGKVVFAYAALRLCDRGVIQLDTPLSQYMPYERLETTPEAKSITARMVLSHTSGLPNWAAHPMSPEWETSKLAPKFKPGSRWLYSAEGFVFLQKVLEHRLKKSVSQLLDEEVFRPLHMRNSSFVWENRFDSVAALGHTETGEETKQLSFTTANASFSLLTTASDYALFLHALMQGIGLKAETHRQMIQVASAADRWNSPPSKADPFINWGLGVGLQRNEKGKALWHWGNNGDFKAFFIAYPDKKESLVYFTNSENGLNITADLLKLFLGPDTYWAVQWLEDEK